MASNLKHQLARYDGLFDENQHQETLIELNKNEDQSLPEIKWRKARAMYKLSIKTGAPKAELVRSAFALVSDAVQRDEKNYAAHKWMAILLDAKSELEGIKERVVQLTTVKYHMKRAVELNPEDPTSWHLLGDFAYALADMPWYQRKVMEAVFATPPSGTYEEALEHFLCAEKKKANFYSTNLLQIAKCYERLNNFKMAKKYLKQACSIQVLNEDDKRCKEEATILLTKY